jgi:hypothetical protein
MLRPRPVADPVPGGEAPPGEQHLAKILAEGVVVGLATGLVGAGGGFLVVPALVLLGGVSMPVAVGTSLLVIAMKSFAGLAGYLHTVSIDWTLALGVTALAVVGALAGGQVAGRVDALILRRAFGWFVVAMAVFILGGQAPRQARDALLSAPGLAVLGVLLAAAGAMTWRLRPGRRALSRRAAPPPGDGRAAPAVAAHQSAKPDLARGSTTRNAPGARSATV